MGILFKKNTLIQTQLIEPNNNAWRDYTHHDFVSFLASGELPKVSFQHYLKQDYLFLKHYARAYALAIYKSDSIAEMETSFTCLQGLIGSELTLHLEYCKQWGLDAKDVEVVEEDLATIAYTRFVLDTGLSGDLLELLVALAPCALGYAEIGHRLFHADTTLSENNPYWPWIEMYSGQKFIDSVNAQLYLLEKLLMQVPTNSLRWQKLQMIFSSATKMETAFWQQGLAFNVMDYKG